MIPLYKPYMPDELPCLEEILHSGALAYGKWGRSFEDALQKYLHCLQVPVTVNSFTAAIHVMLAALGVKRGDEIIASPQSCLASTMPLLSYGAKLSGQMLIPSGERCALKAWKEKFHLRLRLYFTIIIAVIRGILMR